jgi:hypothetical protein
MRRVLRESRMLCKFGFLSLWENQQYWVQFFCSDCFSSGWLLGAAALLRDGGEVGCSSNPL